MNIHQSGLLTALAWLVPHETAAVSARSVYTIQPCTMSLHACLAVNCHQHFWQNDSDLSRATAVTRGGTDTEIRVNTESRPWKRTFSRHSCTDSNPRLFSRESCALTTELSPFPKLTIRLSFHIDHNPCWNGGRIFFSRVDFLC